MNLRLILRLLKRDLDLGPRSPFVIFAVTFPLVMTLVIQLVFGSLLDPEPRFGIVDHGSSQIASAAREVSGISVTDVDTDAELKQLVADHDLDAGIVLHDGFDEELQAGDLPFLGLYIAGESLASDRLILTEIVTELVRDAADNAADVEIDLIAVGDEPSVPIETRLLPFLVLYALLIAGAAVPALSIVQEREKRTLNALLITPVRVSDVLISRAVMGYLLAMIAAIFTLALNGAFGEHPWAMTLILAVAAVMAAEWGLLMGVLASDTNALFTMLKTMNIFFFGPAIFFLFPNLPEWIAHIFPTYYFLRPMFDVAVHGASLNDALPWLAAALGFCLLFVPVIGFGTNRMRRALAV